MRFGCNTCELVFEHQGSIQLGGFVLQNLDTGETFEIPAEAAGTWKTTCPRCGQPAAAINQVSVSDGTRSVMGFADNEGHIEALRSSIQELHALAPDASLEEVAGVLEQQGLGHVAQYLREHALELAALGVGLVGVVIALLAWLQPVSTDKPTPQPVPDGVTYDQMERLVEELRDEVGSGKDPAEGGNHEPEKRHVDPPRAEGHGGAKRDSAHQ